MKKTLLKLGGCLLTLALIVCGIRTLDHIVRPLEADNAFEQIDTFHKLPEDTIEVVVYGSSHAYRSVNPLQLYRDYGIGAYNYGMTTQRINTTTLFVKDSLLTQKPRLAIIETYYCNDVRQDIDMTLDIFYTRYLNIKTPFKYLRQCFGNSLERYLSYFMPLCAFHDNWNTLEEQSFRPQVNDGTFLRTMGYKESQGVNEVTLYPTPAKEKPLSEASVKTFEEMVDALSESGTEVLLITFPYSKKTGFSYGNALEQFADKHSCTYLNLFNYIDEIGLDTKTDFSDVGHLNDYGAAKLTDFLGKYIASHYQLTDMRAIPDNLWTRVDQGLVQGISDI